jgi:hypothetical protein
VGDVSTLGDINSANTTIVVNGDYHITAVFSRPTLTVRVNGGGNVTPEAGEHYYDIGSNATLSAAPNANWAFLNWTGAVSSNETSANVTMDIDKTVTANFHRTHGDLALDVSGNGGINPDAGTHNYPAGTPVNIIAAPSAGWQFVQWSGDTSEVSNIYAANATVTINGDYHITAVFAEIGVSNAGGGGGWSGGAGSAATIDKTITGLLTLTNDDGFIFDSVEAISYDALAALKIPYGTVLKNKAGSALSVITMINVKEPDAPQAGTQVIGSVYDLQPDGAVFDPPVPLTITYAENSFPGGVSEDMLCIALWDKATKTYIPLDVTVDTGKNTLTAYISQFSRYAILAKPKPAEFVLSDLVISPDDFNLGDKVDVSIGVTNIGHLSGGYTCKPVLNGKPLEPQSVILEGGQQATLHFTFPALDRGKNGITIGDFSGSFEVSLTPPAFKVVSLRVSERYAEIGQRIDIKALIENTGQATGTYIVSLVINGSIQEARKVTVPGETSREVRFNYTTSRPGRIAPSTTTTRCRSTRSNRSSWRRPGRSPVRAPSSRSRSSRAPRRRGSRCRSWCR